MGTSQSRTSSTEGNSSSSSAAIDRLKRYSRPDLKLPLKSAFGRQQQQQQQQPKDSAATTATAGHGAKTESTPASDYETPIYETSQTKAAAVRFWWLCRTWRFPHYLYHPTSQLPATPPRPHSQSMPATVPCEVGGFSEWGSLRWRLLTHHL